MNLLLGQKLIKQKEFGKALEFFLNLKKSKQFDKKIFFYLGLIYFELNNFKESIIYYQKFLIEEPNSLSALFNIALVNQTIGNISDAKKNYIKFIELDNRQIRTYYGLYTLDPNFITDDYFNKILNIKNNLNLDLYERGLVDFILSKREKKNKNLKNEILYLTDFHKNIFNHKYQYNLSSQFYYNQIINQHFNKIKIKNDHNTANKNNDISPIFIIGLPRSGSTLIESIVTSGEKKIRTFGECNVVNISVLEQIGPKIYNKEFDAKKFEFEIDMNKFKESLFKKYKQFNSQNELLNNMFVDKSLENIFNIDLILKIFPNAKFLHTFRNLKDSIISIYQSMLPELSWAHNIEDILVYIENYLKIIQHFKSNNPGTIMDIGLEHFTQNSEEVSKQIFEFCNLTWNKNVSKFYERKDLRSKTLSTIQIRSKVEIYEKKKYQQYYYLLNDYKKKYKWLDI